jgi:hypothetical protein
MICSNCGDEVNAPNPHAVSGALAIVYSCKPCDWFDRWLGLRARLAESAAREAAMRGKVDGVIRKYNEKWNDLGDRPSAPPAAAIALVLLLEDALADPPSRAYAALRELARAADHLEKYAAADGKPWSGPAEALFTAVRKLRALETNGGAA